MDKLLFFVLTVLLFGCQEKSDNEIVIAETLAVDSFEIGNVQSLSEFLTLHQLNSSTFRSMNMQTRELNYYVKANKVFELKSSMQILPKEYLPCFFRDRDNICYTIDDEGTIYKYAGDFSILDTIDLTYTLPFLGKHYTFLSYNSEPLIKLGDTIIGSIGYKGVENYFIWFKEPAMMEFILKGDSMKNVQCYLSKPQSIKNAMYPWPSYCYVDRTIVLLYPNIDTLYTYNRNTKQENKIHISNPDFKTPTIYNTKNFMDFSYNAKYELANFRYEAVYFNELTKHYILIYKLPAENKDKNKLSSYNDQHRYVLVLDNQFNTISRVRFERHYFEPANYFFIAEKGLAMPVFRNKTDYVNTKYYIYNF